MDCYIFDIDGTLADGAHRVQHLLNKPKRWDLYNAGMAEDAVFQHVAKLCRQLSQLVPIIYCTGREDVFRSVTLDWLQRHELAFHTALCMRKAKDYRSDDVIKLEMLHEIRALGYNPLMAFDDRNRVVVMWRANGVPCAQVAEGDF